MKTEFAQLIIDKLKGLGESDNYNSATPIQAGTLLATGITEYLIDNITVSINYAGITPSGSPDPIVSDSIGILGNCPPIIVSGDINFNNWLAKLTDNIKLGFLISGNLVTPITPLQVFTTLPPITLQQSQLKTAQENNMDDPQLPVWETIAEAIMIWLSSLTGLTYPATTGTSTGVATIIKLTIT